MYNVLKVLTIEGLGWPTLVVERKEEEITWIIYTNFKIFIKYNQTLVLILYNFFLSNRQTVYLINSFKNISDMILHGDFWSKHT